jgi:kinesin family protein 15
MKRGVFVDSLTEKSISNGKEAYEVLSRTWVNRRVAETSMNRESSRSHAVFTITIESKRKESKGGVVNIRTSQLNLVDLAGSERQRDTQAVGIRLKEAGSINKSLSALGNVIMALVEVSHGKQRYVHYRDSKLTFLLRDSLGGNAKTFVIANVHPGAKCFGETLSTLNFARRAKEIKNRAVVNEDTTGNIAQLQLEVRRLREELAQLKAGSRPAAQISHQAVTLSTASEQDVKATEELKDMLKSAMHGRDKAERDRKLQEEKVKKLMELCNRKDKFMQSTKMILRLREAHIMDLQKALKDAGSVDVENETILALRNQITELEKKIDYHPEVGRLALMNEQLRSELKQLQSNGNEDLTTDLTKAHRYTLQLERQLSSYMEGKMITSECCDHLATIEKARKDISRLEKELEESGQRQIQTEEKSRKRQVELEGEAVALRQSNIELEETIKAMKLKSTVELSALNEMHMKTIKMLTPAKGSPKRQHSSSPIPMSPVALISSELPPEELQHDLPTLPEEDDNAVDPREALTEEIRALQEEKSQLQSHLQELETVVRKMKEENTQLRHQLSETEQLVDCERVGHKSILKEMHAELHTLKQQKDEVEKDRDSFRDKIQELEATLSSVDKQLKETKRTVRREQSMTANDLSKAEAEVVRLQVELTSSTMQCERAIEERDALQAEIETVQQEAAFHEDRADKLEQTVKSRQGHIEELEHEINLLKERLEMEAEQTGRLLVQLKEGSADKERELVQAVEETACLRSELTELSGRNEDQTKQIKDLELSLESKEVENAELLRKIQESRESVETLMSDVQRLRGECTETEGVSASLREELEGLKMSYTELQAENTQLTTRLSNVREQLERVEKKQEQEKNSDLLELEMLREDNIFFSEENEQLKATVTQQADELTALKEQLKESQMMRKELTTQISELKKTASTVLQSTSFTRVVDAEVQVETGHDSAHVPDEREDSVFKKLRNDAVELGQTMESLERQRSQRLEEILNLKTQLSALEPLKERVVELEASKDQLELQWNEISDSKLELQLRLKNAQDAAERSHAAFEAANKLKEEIVSENLSLGEEYALVSVLLCL